MNKVKITVEMNGEVRELEHDGVVIVAIDKADDGGIDISTLANVPLHVGLKALEEAVEKETGIKQEDDNKKPLN